MSSFGDVAKLKPFLELASQIHPGISLTKVRNVCWPVLYTRLLLSDRACYSPSPPPFPRPGGALSQASAAGAVTAYIACAGTTPVGGGTFSLGVVDVL